MWMLVVRDDVDTVTVEDEGDSRVITMPANGDLDQALATAAIADPQHAVELAAKYPAVNEIENRIYRFDAEALRDEVRVLHRSSRRLKWLISGAMVLMLTLVGWSQWELWQDADTIHAELATNRELLRQLISRTTP